MNCLPEHIHANWADPLHPTVQAARPGRAAEGGL
jgi:hypothetical protein